METRRQSVAHRKRGSIPEESEVGSEVVRRVISPEQRAVDELVKIRAAVRPLFSVPIPEGELADRSLRLYAAIKKILAQENWDFYTIQSFPGLSDDYSATCLAQSLMLDEHVGTSTLSDFNTLMTVKLLTDLSVEPVYYGDLLGQLKCFFDRTYSFFNPDFSSRVPAGKKAVLILAQANPDPDQFADIFPRYKRWLKLYGFEPVRLLRAVGVKDPGDLYQQPDLLAQAATLARELVQPG